MSILLATLTLLGVTLIEPPSHHVQGIDVEGGILWVTSVDRATRAGFLTRYDLASGRRLASVAVHDGERFHPGGIQVDGDSIWVPVAEYRQASTTWIQQRDKVTLALVAQFEVADHKIVNSRLVASGLGGPDKAAIDWVDPATLEVTRRIVTGATDRGVPYTNEGMTIRGSSLYLLPEDDRSRLFRYQLP